MTLTAGMAARRDRSHRCRYKLLMVRAAHIERNDHDTSWLPSPRAYYHCVCGCVAVFWPHRPIHPTERVFV